MRADHLGLYGYQAPTSPFLDRLAAESWTFEHAYSHYSFTWPTVANLMTGIPYSELVSTGTFQPGDAPLTPSAETLAERLGKVGVRSVAVSANPYVTAAAGFAQGFASFHDDNAWLAGGSLAAKRTGSEVNASASSLLEELATQPKPWLLYLHYYDSHMPYIAPAEEQALFADPGYQSDGRISDGWLYQPDGKSLAAYRTAAMEAWIRPADIRQLVALYDAEIHHFDQALAQLFRKLQEDKLRETTIVIITADHGEAFYERGYWGHGRFGRREETWVPLIVVPPAGSGTPRGAGRRIADPVTTTDIFYTLLRHFEAPIPAASGQQWAYDLFARQAWRSVVSTESHFTTSILRDRRYSFYRQGEAAEPVPGFRMPAGEWLFDLSRDPGEVQNLFSEAGARDLLQRLEAGAGVGNTPSRVDPKTEEIRKRLSALGYVGNG